MTSNILNLKFSELKIILKALSEIEVPDYMGTTLRGAFGLSLKEVSCIDRKKCKQKCERPFICAYGYVFETPVPEKSKIMRKYEHAPHPFVLTPPINNKRIYKKGDNLEFNLVLIGRAIKFLTYFIFAIMKMGERGIGKNRKEGKGKFRIEKVYYKDRVIYDGKNDVMNVDYYEDRVSDLIISDYKNLKFIDITFLTPARIIYNKKLAENLEFHVIMRNLLRRAGLLLYFHSGEEPDLNAIRSLIAKAEDIELIESDYKKVYIERYSMRQRKRIKYDGVIGRFRYRGDLVPFIPYLKLGEKIHLGKNTSFGFGKYRIEIY